MTHPAFPWLLRVGTVEQWASVLNIRPETISSGVMFTVLGAGCSIVLVRVPEVQ